MIRFYPHPLAVWTFGAAVETPAAPVLTFFGQYQDDVRLKAQYVPAVPLKGQS